MAQKTQPRLLETVATPQHYVPATAREMRVQAVQRLQVGLFGLAAMLLLVGLANIIMDRARLTEDEPVAADSRAQIGADKKVGSDPLADIGVVPAADSTADGTPPKP